MGRARPERARDAKGAIETFIIDWPMLSFIGLLFGYFSPGERWWSSRAFYWGLASAVAFTAVAFISYAVAPDWMWGYFFAPSEVVWALPGIAIGYLFVFALGFAAAVGLRPLGRTVVGAMIVAALLGEIGAIAITWERYHLVGSRQQWLRGLAHELLTVSPTGPVKTIGTLGAVFAAIFAVSLLFAWRSRRAASARG